MYFHKPQEKPRKWGSFQDVQYAVMKNCEKVYDIDPESMVLSMPLFWGLPPMDFSGLGNHGTNHGATYKDKSLDLDGTSDYIGFDSSLGLIYPFTFFCHFYPRDFVNAQSLMDVANSSVDNQRDILYFRPDVANDPAQIFTQGGASYAWCYTPQGVSTSGWHSAHSVFAAAQNRSVYLDGGNVSTNTVDSASPTGKDRFRIGIRSQLAEGLPFNGLIDEANVFNIALTADQIALQDERPWALYQPVSKPVYSFTAAPPPPEFIPQIIMF